MIEFETRRGGDSANVTGPTARAATDRGALVSPPRPDAALTDDLSPESLERDRRSRRRMYALLENLLDDRRRNLRVPMGGRARWRSGEASGACRLLNVSPEGAAFMVPLAEVFRLGVTVTLDAELTPALEWSIADRAQVVRRTPRPNGQCEIAVVFPTAPQGAF